MRQAIVRRISSLVYGADTSVFDKYHLWYYNTEVWKTTSWFGVPTYKSPSDMWNYQEILFELQPSLIIEFGTLFGGSALFFACVMRQIGNAFKVFSVDINGEQINEKVKRDPDVELMTISSVDVLVAQRISELRKQFPGKLFAILDSDHRKNHVLAEMKLLRPLLATGDYLVVEDSNINGHPVSPEWGEGPLEAIEEYLAMFPDDYSRDLGRERKFGFTFAPNGFLVRREKGLSNRERAR